MEDHKTALTERIAFAEGWLVRARRQVQDGDQTRGVLTLMLAEAEVHRARELGAITADPGASRPAVARGAMVALAAAAALIGATVGVWRPAGPAAARDSAARDGIRPPIVVLAGGTGSMLRMVQAREAPVERTVVRSVILRVTASPSQAPASLAALPTPAAPVPVTHLAPPRPESRPVAAPLEAAPSAPALLSEADLIDLVLAAERSLRRSANQ